MSFQDIRLVLHMADQVPGLQNYFEPETSDHKVFPEKVPDVENWVTSQTSDHKINEIIPEKIPPQTETMKLETPSEPPLSMSAGFCYKPKQRNPPKPDGEDAHFICSWNNTIGVADGVGGWGDRGVDPSLYAKGIMGNIIMAFVDNPVPNPSIDFPYLAKILEEAHANTKVPGSSTVCLLALSGHHLLCLNVGDSGFRVIRKGKTIYGSTPQVKSFNYPYQLGGEYVGDKPSSALQFKVRVKIGDVVIVGTDGLFDNVFTPELEELVDNGRRSKDTPHGVAEKIAEFARLKSIHKTCSTPFSLESQTAGKKHKGGKKDDITVVVAYIV